MTILGGSLVTFDYTLKDEDGNVIDSSENGEPLAYTHGRSELVPGLEVQMAGMQEGESKSVTVKPEKGYGPVDQGAIVEVPIDRIPADARQVGRRLQAEGPDGQSLFPVVKEVRESVVVLDFNHPLAGKTLHFDVKIRTIEKGADAGSAEGAQTEETGND